MRSWRTRREASYFVTAFTACVLTLVSREALATIRQPCSDMRIHVAPLPIAAGEAAVLVLPNERITSFDVQWLAPDGTEIPYDRSDADGRVHLRPRMPVVPGVHTFNYTDDCDPTDPLKSYRLEFKSAPPPSERLGTLRVTYQRLCSYDISTGYWPPPVTVAFDLDPALLPYAARLQIHIKDDTGTFDDRYWAVEKSLDSFTFITPDCGDGGSLPPGERTFVAEARFVDGPPLTPANATLALECPRCGANSHTADGGDHPPGASPATPSPQSISTESHGPGCAVTPGRSGSRHAPWSLLALGFAGLAGLAAARLRPRR